MVLFSIVLLAFSFAAGPDDDVITIVHGSWVIVHGSPGNLDSRPKLCC